MSNDAAKPHASDRRPPRVLFFGMRCAFSGPPLAALLRAPVEPAAIVVPGPRGGPPVTTLRPAGGSRPGGRTVPLAPPDDPFCAAGVPLLTINGFGDPAVAEAIAGYEPDVIAVACFPWRVPANLRRIPRLGILNVHPSLLPRGRGPEPLFWTFRRGERETGTTVHLMDGGFDTGSVLRQERLPVPAGIDGGELEWRLAKLGGRLLVEAIMGLDHGTISPAPQDDALATAAPVPTADDLIVATDQPAARVFDLIRGLVPLYGPVTVRIVATGEEIPVAEAVGLDPDGAIDRPAIDDGATLRVRFAPGVLTLRRLRALPAGGGDSLTPLDAV